MPLEVLQLYLNYSLLKQVAKVLTPGHQLDKTQAGTVLADLIQSIQRF